MVPFLYGVFAYYSLTTALQFLSELQVPLAHSSLVPSELPVPVVKNPSSQNFGLAEPSVTDLASQKKNSAQMVTTEAPAPGFSAEVKILEASFTQKLPAVHAVHFACFVEPVNVPSGHKAATAGPVSAVPSPL